MEVTPKYGPVGKFFEYQPVYRVPKYQRAYSWEQLEIEDFIKDLETCYKKRKYEDPAVHFFGQIVCVTGELQGTDGHKFYELVDGQQRIATFVLLVTSLINIYKDIIATDIAGNLSYNNEKILIEERIKGLTQRYIVFQKEIEQSIQDIRVLVLSKRDLTFFHSFVLDTNEEPTNESQKLIKQAYGLIHDKVKTLTHSGTLLDRIGNLKMIEQILESDFCILNMITGDRKAAFKLFQVLNNRGKNLTEGDLLRAECLRMLEPHPNEQEIIERAWDNILADMPIDTVEFLRAIYGSYTGQKADTNSLFNDFISHFLPENEHVHINEATAILIKNKVVKIEEDIDLLRKLSAGQWPYFRRPPIEDWDCNRLYLLINALGHRECLVYLLSAQLLPQTLFRDIIQMLERFVFRYLIIGNQYLGDLIDIYHEEAKIVRDNPQAYTINNLQSKLQTLINRVNDDMFKRQLDDFKYARVGKSLKPLKYFLLTLEHHYRWYRGGAHGTPFCLDKERVYDFTGSTIEHVYPHNGIGSPPIVDTNLDPLKNQIGNLTILGNSDNRTGDNDDFITKKPIFQESSLMINREDVAVKPHWDQQVIQDRTEELKNIACAIFRL
ncbi:DUF262 domain-containing protein [Flavobacterium sp.]|uniref:DUF262 domain-containing protein n=1 Tax=Flavobacterium sp. TaxID=239 RepID=UPI00391D4E77